MNNKEKVYIKGKELYIISVPLKCMFCVCASPPTILTFSCVFSSRIGDVDDLPDIRVEVSSPGPRVTFNIQDTVNLQFFYRHVPQSVKVGMFNSLLFYVDMFEYLHLILHFHMHL